MRFRLFNEKDALEVSNVIGRAVRIRDNSGYSDSEIESLANYYTPENFCKDAGRKFSYVCLAGRKIIGTGTLRDDEAMAVFIEPEYQRKGIGVKLMNILEDEAVKKGYAKVWLVASLSAVDFYKKLEYLSIGEKYHPSWGKGIIMEKELTADKRIIRKSKHVLKG